MTTSTAARAAIACGRHRHRIDPTRRNNAMTTHICDLTPSGEEPESARALRDRIAEALYAHDHPGHLVPLNETGMGPAYRESADAVLAVLPPPADRAAVLRELEERYRGYARDSAHPDFRAAYAAVANDLSRMADEAQQQPERPRCPHCQMPHDLTPSGELACASIRASIADTPAVVSAVPPQPEETAAVRQPDWLDREPRPDAYEITVHPPLNDEGA